MFHTLKIGKPYALTQQLLGRRDKGKIARPVTTSLQAVLTPGLEIAPRAKRVGEGEAMANHTTQRLWLQKQLLLGFWSNFGGSKCDGRGYSKDLKLEKLRLLAEEQLPSRKTTTLAQDRAKFEKVKRARHKRTTHKFCFGCGGEANVRHHIIQLQYGGVNSKRNIVSLCWGCHAAIHPWLK